MIYEAESGDIEICLTGESLISRKLSVFREEYFLKLREIILNADVSFSNAECLFQDYADYPNTYAGGGSGQGTYMAAPPESIEELRWLGIDIVSTANNHASDFGDQGIISNLEFLEESGMPHAGTGMNLAEARAPAYLDNPKGRIALMAAADWGPRGTGAEPWPFPMGVMAGEQSPYSIGRPGCNLVRHKTKFTVTESVYNELKKLGESLFNVIEQNNQIHLFGSTFVVGKEFSMETIAEEEDLEENYKWMRDATKMADWTIFSFHNHGASNSPELPSSHTRTLAKGLIDNGADIFIGHGPHRDRGIEIYNGKPIFYSLGDFILQNDTPQWIPYDVMKRFGLGHSDTPSDFHEERKKRGWNSRVEGWESAIATCKFTEKKLREISLYPIDLGMGLPRSIAGRPVLAEPGSEVNERVLKRFQDMSKPYGTEISIEDGVGKIKIS